MFDIVSLYNKAIEKEFLFLKLLDCFQTIADSMIPLDDYNGYLMPVSILHVNSDRDIALLSKWREENSFAFPTQFKVSNKGTRSWLENLISNVGDRILFFVVNKHGEKIGHIGFANCINSKRFMEIDNVVRGQSTDKGIMSSALKTLISWAIKNFHPEEIFLRVFEDNSAVSFYEKNNFKKDILIPLRKKGTDELISYVEIEDDSQADKNFLRMIWEQKDNNYKPEDQILTAGPLIGSQEIVYTSDAIRSGWNSKWDYYLERFSRQFADFIGVKYALPTSCCTGALHISLLALGIGEGDEVIVPDITWVATANAVVYTGATPVFADVDKDTWCLDPKSFKKKITPKTKAVIPVHLYGNPADMNSILDIAKEHKLKVVEDAAPAVGALFDGRKCGSFGDFACFSFQGAKLMVTGEGGMLLTNNEQLYLKAKKIWDQGRVPGTFWIDETGWKYKMSNVQAALGLGQLNNVEKLIMSKVLINKWYEEGLSSLKGIKLWESDSRGQGIYWMTSIILDEYIDREDFIKRLKDNNIDSRVVFPPISQYPIWENKTSPGANAKYIGANAVNLPSGVCMEKKQVDYICQIIRKLIQSVYE